MSAALPDVIVIDLSHVLAGPYCAMTLGDLGATVFKIERPGTGDDSRQFGPPYKAGESAYYLGLNRNEHSIELDFDTPDGREHLLELLRGATVVVDNFRPGTLEKRGLGYESLRAINPGLIYCSISSYGLQGARAAEPGYDLIIQGESGLMSITGEINGEPVPVGSSVVDVATGMVATTAILAALHVRDRTGEGQYIHVSLLETAVSLLANVASSYLLSQEEAMRYGNAHPTLVPYQVFKTCDGHMTVACCSDTLFTSLCNVLELPKVAEDHRFASNSERVLNRNELSAILQEHFLQRDTADWLLDLRKAGIPCGPILKVSEALEDPHLQAQNFIWKCEHPTAGPIRLIGSPMHLSKTPPRLYKAPPLLGEDNTPFLDPSLIKV